MFEYNICNQADESIFSRQCLALEKNIPSLEKENILQDVDGTSIQIYKKDQKKIKVINDPNVDAVYIQSEIELKQFFN